MPYFIPQILRIYMIQRLDLLPGKESYIPKYLMGFIKFRIFPQFQRAAGHPSQKKIHKPLSALRNFFYMPQQLFDLHIQTSLLVHFPDRCFQRTLTFFDSTSRNHPDIPVFMMLTYHQHTVLIIHHDDSYSAYPHNNAPAAPITIISVMGFTLKTPDSSSVAAQSMTGITLK